jgi:hypothetical protein
MQMAILYLPCESDLGVSLLRCISRTYSDHSLVSTKMEATFKNHSTGQEMVIDLNGDFWGGSADLSVQGGPVIAQITRDVFSAREVFTSSNAVSQKENAASEGD